MAAAIQKTVRRHKPRGTALIVEDSRTDAALIASQLAQLGFRYDITRDGAQGVKAAVGGNYDFILMDIEMPNLDGFEATKAIHAMLGPHSPFIVAVTARTSDGDKRRCEEAGMDYFLSKPIRLATLARLVGDE
jgi:CheY-like chemotaxis protein